MNEERFMELVKEYDGFEFYQAYRNDEDHILGGKGDTFWYIISKKGKAAESYIGKFANGTWTDQYIKGQGANAKTKAMKPGTTIARIAEKAYLMQSEKWVAGRKPKVIEDNHPHYHFVKGFGDIGLDVSAKYGVTITYSNIADVAAGFHLRYLYTGSEVELP
ncbi:MAG: hypothetical protein K6G89_05460 [Clostridia bacterium]|nr:hypothetical protein [Clostridia bacterium]